MNAIININEQSVYQAEEKEESNKVTFGDIFAFSTLGYIHSSFLWSVVEVLCYFSPGVHQA